MPKVKSINDEPIFEPRLIKRKHLKVFRKQGIDVLNISDEKLIESFDIIVDTLYPDRIKDLDELSQGSLIRLVEECVKISYINEDEGDGKN